MLKLTQIKAIIYIGGRQINCIPKLISEILTKEELKKLKLDKIERNNLYYIIK
jgi:hypothetical protein